MAGTVKIWWHDGSVKDVRFHDIPVANEPELGYETIAVSATAAASAAAPSLATVAIVETDVNVRYLVRRPGDTADADVVTSKPIAATGFGTDVIGIVEGYTISFIEA
ncbi:MAG: hypothetical protein AAF479_18295 [Pseudomonadota bacterium]